MVMNMMTDTRPSLPESYGPVAASTCDSISEEMLTRLEKAEVELQDPDWVATCHGVREDIDGQLKELRTTLARAEGKRTVTDLKAQWIMGQVLGLRQVLRILEDLEREHCSIRSSASEALEAQP
eukprot:CAMPEP_0178437908 /NCGR_PEP_ID=MMETSP0689_2-20121128/35269_1 /TAXON_ID=160604 /ORGANISM="Amphidinium massartii, Strain CS-259" /LENGTH=123 /DNA_ID=CAMNT_0020060193 /DNA_START=36 /DNA_END=403 /DNA_ORIENTATION=-